MQRNSIKYGDIFTIGRHTLACGDARDPDIIQKAVRDRKIHLLLSDPPYGIQYIESKNGFGNVKVNKKILNDDITNSAKYACFTGEWLKAIKPYLAKKNAVYIFNCDKMMFALKEGMDEAEIYFSQLLVWVKSQPIIGRKDYLPMHELIAYGWHGTHKFMKAKDKSVIFCPKPSRSSLHPTQKPVALLRKLVLNSSNVNDIVYDCFAGSGSTGIACEQTGRRSILIESDEEYCQTIINRFKRVFNISPSKL